MKELNVLIKVKETVTVEGEDTDRIDEDI